jgi:hypothetical protein
MRRLEITAGLKQRLPITADEIGGQPRPVAEWVAILSEGIALDLGSHRDGTGKRQRYRLFLGYPKGPTGHQNQIHGLVPKNRPEGL